MGHYVRAVVNATLLALLALGIVQLTRNIWSPPVGFIHNGTVDTIAVGDTVTCDDENGCGVVCPSLHMCNLRHTQGEIEYEHEVHGGASTTGVTESVKYHETITVEWEH